MTQSGSLGTPKTFVFKVGDKLEAMWEGRNGFWCIVEVSMRLDDPPEFPQVWLTLLPAPYELGQ